MIRSAAGPHRPRNDACPHRCRASGLPIVAGEVYPVDEAKSRTGWGDVAFSQAKAAGLRVLCFGKYTYVAANDIIEFLQKQPQVDRNRGGGRPDLVRALDSRSGSERAVSRTTKGANGESCENC
jgi:hypothetical protein